MFPLFSKPLNQLAYSDVLELIEARATESQTIEFKSDLQVENGSKHPWHTETRKIDAYSRDDILKEVVAFANAEGGNVILGMAESKDGEKRAQKDLPLPDCVLLADRLRQLAETHIEPPLPRIEWRGIPKTEADNAGVVLARVPPSRLAPHRVKATGEFYLRHGENSLPMTIRDIHDSVLRSASMFDAVKRRLDDRLSAPAKFLELYPMGTEKADDWAMRVTVLPTSAPIFIDRPYTYDLLFPQLEEFRANESGHEVSLALGQAGRALHLHAPQPILRGARRESWLEGRNTCVVHEVHADGMVEFMLRFDSIQDYGGALVPVGSVLGLTANALMIAHLARELAEVPSVELVVDIEIQARGDKGRLRWFPDPYREASPEFHQNPVRLPRYTAAGPETFPAVIKLAMNSLRESAGLRATDDFSIDLG